MQNLLVGTNIKIFRLYSRLGSTIFVKRVDFVHTHFVHIVELSFKCNVNSSCTWGWGWLYLHPSFGRSRHNECVLIQQNMSVRGAGSRGSFHGIFLRLYWQIFIQFYTRCTRLLQENFTKTCNYEQDETE